MTNKDELAELKAKVAALEAKVDPPKSTFVEMSDAEHRDMVHQMRERQMNSWMPPSAVQDLVAAEPRGFMQGVLRDNRAPTGRPGMIPRTEEVSNAREPSPTPGWLAPTPLSNPPGVAQADKLMDEQDRRDREELARKLGK
jgi:hypothetical protein